MGYRKTYGKLKVVKYSGFGSKKERHGVMEVNSKILVSAVKGFTKPKAKKLLPYYKKQRTYHFP